MWDYRDPPSVETPEPTPCEVCGEDTNGVEDQDFIILEFAENKCFDPDTCDVFPGKRCVVVWHRKCFEERFGVSGLPED